MSWVREQYGQRAPIRLPRAPQRGERVTARLALKGQPVRAVAEVLCGGVGVMEAAEADAAADRGGDRLEPSLVLRGCAAECPPSANGLTSRISRADAAVPPLWDESSSTRRALALHLLRDAVERPVQRRARAFTCHPTAWASRGGKVAAMYYDSFDNLHTMVAGQRFLLVFHATRPRLLDFLPDENAHASGLPT